MRKLAIAREFLCKDLHNKDGNGMDLTEAEILIRGVKNTQKNYSDNIFMTQIIMMGWSLT